MKNLPPKNLSRRINVGMAAFKIHLAGTRCWSLVARIFGVVTSAVLGYSKWTAGRRVKKISHLSTKLMGRVASIAPEFQTFHRLPEYRKKKLLETRDAILEENKHLQEAVITLNLNFA